MLVRLNVIVEGAVAHVVNGSGRKMCSCRIKDMGRTTYEEGVVWPVADNSPWFLCKASNKQVAKEVERLRRWQTT